MSEYGFFIFSGHTQQSVLPSCKRVYPRPPCKMSVGVRDRGQLTHEIEVQGQAIRPMIAFMDICIARTELCRFA